MSSRVTTYPFWKGDGGLLGFRGALRYDDTRGLAQRVLRVDRDAESHLYARCTTGDISGYS
jgi:hypothetical protein